MLQLDVPGRVGGWEGGGSEGAAAGGGIHVEPMIALGNALLNVCLLNFVGVLAPASIGRCPAALLPAVPPAAPVCHFALLSAVPHAPP